VYTTCHLRDELWGSCQFVVIASPQTPFCPLIPLAT
jgi:hypothetical protein